MTVFGLRAPPAKLLLTAARRAVAWAVFQRKCFTSLGCLVTGGRNTAPTFLSKFQAGGFFLLRTEIGDERIFMWGFLFVFSANLFNRKKMWREFHFPRTELASSEGISVLTVRSLL